MLEPLTHVIVISGWVTENFEAIEAELLAYKADDKVAVSQYCESSAAEAELFSIFLQIDHFSKNGDKTPRLRGFRP